MLSSIGWFKFSSVVPLSSGGPYEPAFPTTFKAVSGLMIVIPNPSLTRQHMVKESLTSNSPEVSSLMPPATLTP